MLHVIGVSANSFRVRLGWSQIDSVSFESFQPTSLRSSTHSDTEVFRTFTNQKLRFTESEAG